MRNSIFGVTFFLLIITSGFCRNSDSEFALWMPYSGYQFNSTSVSLEHTGGTMSDTTLLDISGTNTIWPAVMTIDFMGLMYSKLDWTGLGAALFNVLGADNFSFSEEDIETETAEELGLGSTDKVSTVTIDGAGILPHYQVGFLFGNNLLHGIGLNFNQLSVGYISGGASEFAPQRNLSQEIGLQYQLVVPIGKLIHINPSFTYNYLGRKWFDEKTGNSLVFENDVVFKLIEYFSIYVHTGYAIRTLESDSDFMSYETEELSINSFTMKIALALHNISLFGSTYGSN